MHCPAAHVYMHERGYFKAMLTQNFLVVMRTILAPAIPMMDAMPVSIAGDCCASLPVMAGLQKSGIDPVLVWLDGHADFNTIETSPSGFLGGMPLAMMVGRSDQTIPAKLGLTPVQESDIWLIDARDLDPPEEKALQKSAINHTSLDKLGNLIFDRPVHLHIDNDIVDASEVPANNYPVTGGPGLVQTIQKCVRFASQNTVCAISFSGWNGRLDQDGKTGKTCAALLLAITDASRQ